MNFRKPQGLIQLVILIVIGLAILAYYGFDIKDWLDSIEFKQKFSSIWNWIRDLWLNYIWHWVVWTWEHVARPIFEKIKLITPEPPANFVPQA